MEPLSARSDRLVRWGLVAYAAAAAFVWSRQIPFNHAPDEFLHFDLPSVIVREGRFPRIADPALLLGGKGSYAGQPPLAALLHAGAIWAAGPAAPRDRALHAARSVSVVFGAGAVWAAGLVGRELFPADPLLALWIPVAMAWTPQVTFVSSYVSDDAPALFFAALAFLVGIVGLRRGWTRKRALAAGLVGGALLLSKPNAWGLGLALAWALARGKKGGRWMPLATLIALALGLPWLIRNTLLYGDPMGMGATKSAFPDLVPLVKQGIWFHNFLFKTKWATSSFNSLWANFDYMSLRLPLWHYFVLYAWAAAAVVASAVALFRSRRGEERPRGVAVPGGDASVFLGLAFLGVVALCWSTSLYNDYQPQGRYLFPALLSIQAVLGIGTKFLGGVRRGDLFVGASAAWLFYLNLASLLLLHRAYAA